MGVLLTSLRHVGVSVAQRDLTFWVWALIVVTVLLAAAWAAIDQALGYGWPPRDRPTSIGVDWASGPDRSVTTIHQPSLSEPAAKGFDRHRPAVIDETGRHLHATNSGGAR